MKKKKIILILTIILIGIVLLNGGFYLFKNKKINEETLNITSMITLDNPEAKVYPNFYLLENEKGITLYNFENQELFQYSENYTDYHILNNTFLVIKNNTHLKILSLTGEVLLEGEENFANLNSEEYFFLNNTLYNKELKEIYTLANEQTKDLSYYMIINDILLLFFNNQENEMIDLTTKEVMSKSFNSYVTFENYTGVSSYFALSYDDTYKIVDTIAKKIILDDVTISGNNVLKNKDGTYYIYNNKIYQNHTNINDDYYMDFTDCQEGGKLVNNDGTIIIDSCSLYYEEPFKDVFVGSLETKSFLKTKDEMIYANRFKKVGQYIMGYFLENDQNSIKIYDEKGKLVKENIEISVLNDALYEGYDLITAKSYFLDKNLNIISDAFSYATCQDSFCYTSLQSGAITLYQNSEKISNISYNEAIFYDNLLVAKTLFHTYLYKIEKGNKIDINQKEEIPLNKEEVIATYNLQNMEKKIEDNEDFFTKYAYLVTKNKSLEPYQQEVMNIFSVVVDVKNYLDEFSFFKKLKELNISYTSDLPTGVAALYIDGTTTINYHEKDKGTLYHELMHFVDFSINKNTYSYNLYKCASDYKVSSSNLKDCERLYLNTNFITEAGAEIYAAKYFTNEMDSYAPAPHILEALEYILGSENISKWYFESDEYFKELWFQLGYSKEEVTSSLDALTAQTQVIKNVNDKQTILIAEALIDLYKKEKDTTLDSDNTFKYILARIISNIDVSSSKYSSLLKSIQEEYKNLPVLFQEIFKDYYLSQTMGDILMKDGKIYLVFLTYKDNQIGDITVDFDFDNKQIRNFNYQERE